MSRSTAALAALLLLGLGAVCARDAGGIAPPPDELASHRGVVWGVIVAGSSGFSNYRHQADAAHAFASLIQHDVLEERIITFIYGDVANDSENPFPGQLFNAPTASGTPGRDVWAGVKLSYAGEDATAANLLAVLTGNASALSGGSGEVLRSGPDDRVFFAFFDHGASGLVAMPAGPYLYANDLAAALTQLRSSGAARHVVLYIEACESGSMCADGLIGNTSGILCVTAASPDESSWGAFCPPDDLVNGSSVGSCLGDVFSVDWMQDSDSGRRGMRESLLEQYVTVRAEVNVSNVCAYGDMRFMHLPIGAFQGNSSASRGGGEQQQQPQQQQHHTAGNALRAPPARAALARRRLQANGGGGGGAPAEGAVAAPGPSPAPAASTTSSRLASIASLRARLRAAALNGGDAARLARLQALLAAELAAAAVAHRAAAHVIATTLGADDVELVLAQPLAGPIAWECYKRANEASADACGPATDFTLRYLRLHALACSLMGGDGGAAAVARLVRSACSKGHAEVRVLGVGALTLPPLLLL